ncbi:response regulator transcription factor [Polymorphum gilvum]|uniref:Response regulators consisting of a CheY-like receiver domain and a winged-helix DNA-binding domain n=1 Tax=Polymorphum gilvum (strain LMG 25793 / CGMCC 1.9160 / SL003B-26A1) TaxID=991905 RepID=F2IXV5_POLGS|nr:response regulator transcription factor [Polymorphum gilvum]ADZ69436.1 Response regulators consisting of a CheY-like receiver domain and a winged-helix DNA-binding domain [Polymorphum gilvum SL003B-26A1]
MTRVLIVEDDEDIASVIARGLQREGYETLCAADVRAARDAMVAEMPDAAIVDMMLGEESGSKLVADLRAKGVRIPIIMLSALSRVSDRTAGLVAGADDYVVKPFEFKELVARLKVQEQRHSGADNQLRYGDLTLDPEQRMVRGGGREVLLTEREAALLTFFLSRPDAVVTRGEIFDKLWAGQGGSTDNVVDVYIGYLRRKLSPMADYGVALKTVRGRGFIMTREVRQ